MKLFRLANIIKQINMNVDDIWKVVKKLKLETSFNKRCGYDGLYSNKQSQITALEQQLNIEPIELRFDNMTAENLSNAAEIFIYLNTCTDTWFKSWYTFYNDLFQTQSVDKIILTLNRMMKSENLDNKIRDEKLFEKSTTLFSLKYEEIQKLFSMDLHEGVANKSIINHSAGKLFHMHLYSHVLYIL